MGDADKAILISLIRSVESLVLDKRALIRLADKHRIPAHVRDAFVAATRGDTEVALIHQTKFRPIYDQVERSPDLSKALQSLLSALQ